MAIRRKTKVLNIAQVAHEAEETFVNPKPLASNDVVRQEIVRTTPRKPLKRVCIIEKQGGFTFFTTQEDREALDFVAFKNKFEKQNVVRAALHDFLSRYYQEGVGLNEQGSSILNQYESTIYRLE